MRVKVRANGALWGLPHHEGNPQTPTRREKEQFLTKGFTLVMYIG